MNCPEIRAALPEFVYGQLSPQALDPIEAHLRDCPECRREAAALGQVRRLLDAAPAPAVRVDAAALYRAAAERQARRLRRWRGVALAACVAATLLFAFSVLTRLEVRVETNQIVVRWGPAPAAPPSAQAPAPPVAPTPAADPRDLMELEDRVRTLSELVQALADDGREREYQRDLENARLKQLVQQWQGTSDRRWGDMEKDFDALYIAEFQTLKGAKP